MSRRPTCLNRVMEKSAASEACRPSCKGRRGAQDQLNPPGSDTLLGTGLWGVSDPQLLGAQSGRHCAGPLPTGSPLWAEERLLPPGPREGPAPKLWVLQYLKQGPRVSASQSSQPVASAGAAPPTPPHHEELQGQLYQTPDCGPRKQRGWDPVRAPSLWVFSHELRGQTGQGTESWQVVTVPT